MFRLPIVLNFSGYRVFCPSELQYNPPPPKNTPREKHTMPKITVLPHAELCPEGAVIENAPSGQTVLDILLDHDIEVDHACEKSCACTTCHVIVRQGFDSLEEASELEEDLLDQAWGLEADSRLSCQAVLADEDLVVEIPKYTINHAREEH